MDATQGALFVLYGILLLFAIGNRSIRGPAGTYLIRRSTAFRMSACEIRSAKIDS